MSKDKVFKRENPYLNLGNIGCIDHVKTILTVAITNVLSRQGEKNVVSRI